MSALPRPDLSAGPHRDLVDALHDLHHRAGWPSLRALARETGVSHTTVSHVFSSPKLATWGTVEVLVEALGGEVLNFHHLWLAASSPADGADAAVTRIAGRRAELAVVRRHLEAGTGLLLVTGEAGMGKTSLVNAGAGSTSAFVARGSCLPLSRPVPYLPVVEALRSIHDSDQGQRLKSALSECPPFVAGELARLLPEIGPTAPDDGSTEWARQRLVGALQSLLVALAALEPIALLLEDLHWADTSTLDLLEHLAGRGAAVPTVGSWRLDDDDTEPANTAWFARVRRMPSVQEVILTPLSRAETLDQLTLEAADMDADAVYERSRGHPLFTAQLAAHGASENLPALLADLLDARLGELDGPAWRLARALGVADRPLGHDVLIAATGLGSEGSTTGLRALAGRRLLDRTAGDIVQLAHPLLAEAVRRRLLPGEGPQQHRMLAEALASARDPEPAEVAAHWRGAGDTEQELEWRTAAAHAAAGRFDRAQEAEHWLRVLELWTRGPAKPNQPSVSHATAYLAAMDALQASLQFDRAAELSDAADVALGPTDDAVQAELLRRAAIFRGQREGSDVGRVLLDEALALYDRLPVCAGLVWARDWKQVLLNDMGDFDGAHRMSRAAVEAATIVGDPSLKRWVMGRLAWQMGVRGDVDGARQMLDQADREVPQGTNPLGDLRRSVIETDILRICGSSAESVLAAGAVGMAVAQELSVENFDTLLVRFNTACTLLAAGRVEQASELIPEEPLGPLDIDRWPIHLLGAVVEGLRGDVGSASERLDRLWHDMADNWVTDVEVMVVSEMVNAWRPIPERSPERLLTALDILVGPTPIRLVAPGLVAAARATAAPTTPAGDTARLPERLHDLHDRSGLASSTAGDAHLMAHEAAWTAEMTRLTGTQTLDPWVRAAAAWEGLERPHDAGYCRWRAAQVALRGGQGTVAAKLLRRAAIDAREHVPLSRAIADTAAAAR